MKKILLLIIAVVFLMIIGCGSRLVKNDSAAEDALTSGQVIDTERLKSGGYLLIVPFTAGVGVPADDTADAVSLMIVKGLIETLKDGSIPFDILSSREANKANLVIKGHIVQLAHPHGIKKWIGKKYTTLEVDGQLVDPETGNIVLYFSDQKMFRKNEQDFEQVAYGIGQGIARFILRSIGKGDAQL